MSLSYSSKKLNLLFHSASGKDKVGRLRLGDTVPVARIEVQITWLR